MKKILVIILVFASVQSFGQIIKKYAQKTNTDLSIDSFYHKLFTDSVFAYADNSFVCFLLEFYQERGLPFPSAFSNFHLDADGIYSNKTQRADAVDWGGVGNKPSTFTATASTVGNSLLNISNPASPSLIRVNTNGTAVTRTVTEAKQDLSIDQVDNTSDANKPVSAATQTALNAKQNTLGNSSVTNAMLAGSIDLTTKVTGTLPFANGGSSGGSTAAPATTGAMTINMTSRMITITPTGACTFNASGGIAGQMITFIITTSGVSSFTLTWGTNFRKTGTLATGTTSARFFAVSFICLSDGLTWMEISRTAAQT